MWNGWMSARGIKREEIFKCTEGFGRISAFASYQGRVKALHDGEEFAF